ncbi:DNA repair metallo-beta-lactamase family protein isoform X2 [Tasmannia lanceolata]|uniref:DNA repair metallo-beta-lactamase family protein isoform X2 n=1 Tax=Tasmannia lanceolata TaxID=3420 RepID=UPI0040648C0E
MEILTDDDLSISENLDENGLPFSSLSEDENNGECDGRDLSIGSSFSSDFFSSGTDWSCLKEKSPNRKLVQRDLFQIWGFKKPETSISRVSSFPSKRKFSISDDLRVDRSKQKVARRVCPFYKKIPGTPFTVDAFRYGLIEGCKAYFLSHFHYDHYGGLSKGWSHGPIYCTPLTARLVKMCLSINPLFIFPLELDTEHVIEGVKVTFLEANHCPGAALIHFCLGDGQCYLHTGDFRASKLMKSYPLLVNHHINVLYLDTTYCNPKYRFPSKEDVVGFVVRIARNSLAKQPKTLIVVGAYSIGKEHVYLAISEALGVQIYANASRRRILQSFGWPQLAGKLSSHAHSTPLHVLPISSLRPESLKQYMKTCGHQFTAVLAFRPTGWTYSENVGNQLDLIRPISKGNVTIYGVPYSEHSSFLELEEFVQFLRPDKIIPTVNIGNAVNRDKMQSYFREWLKA